MNKKNIFGWSGIFMCIFAVFFAIWAGGWWGIVGGIILIVEGFKLDPINSMWVGIGVLRFVAAGFIGWLSFVVLFSFGSFLLHMADV